MAGVALCAVAQRLAASVLFATPCPFGMLGIPRLHFDSLALASLVDILCRRPLEVNDIWQLAGQNRTEKVQERARALWHEERKKAKPNLFLTMLRMAPLLLAMSSTVFALMSAHLPLSSLPLIH